MKSSKCLNNIETNIEQTEKSVKKFSELFAPNSDENAAEGFSSKLAKQTALHIRKTTQDNEDRENNVILFRVTEPEAEDGNGRKIKDKAFFDELCTVALGINKIELANITRIGTKPSTENSKRPIKVAFKTLFDKRKFMSSLVKLKELDSTSIYRRINISHDLSPEMRHETKKLLKQAYDKNQASPDNDFLWKVRGPPCSPRLVKVNKV